jgi:N-acyl-D-aspartate/D-glutamate deacylase
MDEESAAGGEVKQMSGPAWVKQATPAQIEKMRALLQQGLEEGGLGIGVLLDYMTAAISEAELRMLFEVAAAAKVPLFVHVRRGYAGDPAGLIEVVTLAKETGAALFVCHITHNAMGGISEWLSMIDEANASGANIATETLSYLAGGTSISADVFRRRDWQKIFDISYEDVQWVATGEWLTKETWDKYAAEQPGGMVNHHYVKEAWLETALKWPRMMISTDALPAVDRDIPSNPNIAGTYSRVLGRYVRETGLLTLNEALARMSLYQAQWMAQVAVAFTKKGRIQLGMDADLVIFDPDTVAANAVYGEPYKPPTGIAHVIVGGRQIVVDSVRVEGRYPGRRILGDSVGQ